MGSDSDMPVMSKAAEVLDKLGVSYEMRIISAHREPDEFFEYAKTAEEKGVKAIIFKSPCAVLIKPEKPAVIDEDKCIGCKKCINSLGCPGIIISGGKVKIDSSLCTGCGLCSQVCPVDAIGGMDK